MKRKRRSCYVPEEIQKEILLRLPVKSLVRFQTVNRTLQRLISTQQFITDHQKTFRCEEDELLVLGRGAWNQISCVRFLDGQFLKHIQDIRLPNETLIYCIRTVGCCNGVVCLIYAGMNELLFMNPSIRKVVVIPASDYLSCKISPLIFGFGYVEDDYKLVVLPSSTKSGTSLMATVFSLNARNWVTVAYSWPQPQDPYYQKLTIRSESHVFVDGACHWLADRFDEEEGRRTKYVLSFNLSGDHTIGIMVFPIFYSSSELNVYNGRLCVIVGNEEIWAMNKGDSTWTRIIYWSMQWIGSWTGQPFVWYKMVGFLSGGDVLFSRRYSLDNCICVELMCYDPTTKIKRILKKYHGSEILSLDRSYANRQNLVLLDQDL